MTGMKPQNCLIRTTGKGMADFRKERHVHGLNTLSITNQNGKESQFYTVHVILENENLTYI